MANTGEHYDWEAIFKQARSAIQQYSCTTIVELAEILGIPRQTLSSAMRRYDVTMAKLLAGVDLNGTDQDDEVIRRLKLQVSSLSKMNKAMETQLTRRDWFENILLETAALMALEPTPFTTNTHDDPTQEQSAVLLVSDVHLGQSTPAEQVGILGEYNSKIATTRLCYIFEKFASVVQHQSFPVQHVYVVFLGDEIEQAHLRAGHEQYTDLNAVKQVLAFTNIAAKSVSMLAGMFPLVTVVGVPGNHGRVTSDPKLSDPTENFDYLSYRIMERMLVEQENVTWQIPECWYQQWKVGMWSFLAIHGSEIRSYAGFPWYGATRTAKRYQAMFRLRERQNLQANPPQTVEEYENQRNVPDYILLAHFHEMADWQDVDAEIIANGAVPGVSFYGASRMNKISRPLQLMFFVHPKYGVGMRLPLFLDHVGENGPEY